MICVYIYICRYSAFIFICSKDLDLDIWLVGYRSSVSSIMLHGMMFLPRFLHLFHPQYLGFCSWAAECTRTETSSFWATSPFTTATQRAPSSSGKTSTLSCRNRSTKVSLHGLYIRRPRPMARGARQRKNGIRQPLQAAAATYCQCFSILATCRIVLLILFSILAAGICFGNRKLSLYSRRRWRYAPPAPIASACQRPSARHCHCVWPLRGLTLEGWAWFWNYIF